MNDNRQVLKRSILIFPAIVTLIGMIIAVQFGCRSCIELPDNPVEKPIVDPLNDKVEDAEVKITTLDNQGSDEIASLSEQVNQAKQVYKNTDAALPLLQVIKKQNEPLVLIAVPENEQWLLAAVAPVAAKIRQLNKIPILLAFTPESIPEQTKLLQRLEPFIGSSIILGADPNIYAEQIGKKYLMREIPITAESSETGLFLANNFWSKADTVVISTMEDSEAVIYGSTLAAHMAVPYMAIYGDENADVLSEKLLESNIKKVLFVTSDIDLEVESINFPKQRIEVLDIPAIQNQLTKKIGAENIRNIILFRTPNNATDDGVSSWLAPYISIMRNAPIVSCYSSDPIVSERNVQELIETYSLTPRNVTILADYDSIGMIKTTYKTDLEEYELEVEPCSRPTQGMAAEMGVGRIPFRQLWAASTLMTRSIAKDHMRHNIKPKVVMIANPNTEYGDLPLCETISRATSKEFENFGIHTDEFYGSSLRDLNLNAIRDSQMIIFEGHITDFILFEEPVNDPDELYYVEDSNGNPNETSIIALEHPIEYAPYSTEDQLPILIKNETIDQKYEITELNHQSLSKQIPQTIHPDQLDGMPLMILQSCHSLDDSALNILVSGTTGIVGSVTNIHSASGSSFIKAFCDGLLYRPETIGEALRDARNYLLCVSALKTERGHTQQAKVNRVAYSFHLWGDPEERIFNELSQKPKLLPVSIKFVSPDKIRIEAPQRRMQTSTTNDYFLRMFPGNEVAGIVKRLKDKDIRRVMPIYFSRITMPKDFASKQYTGLKKLDDDTSRAVFLADPFERFLYVLYFPEKDEKNEVVELQFAN